MLARIAFAVTVIVVANVVLDKYSHSTLRKKIHAL